MQRYDLIAYYDELETSEDVDGEWVKYDDHIAAMQAKDAEIDELLKDVTFLQSGKDVIHDELRAENERLRAALKDMVPDEVSWKEGSRPSCLIDHPVSVLQSARAALQHKAEG